MTARQSRSSVPWAHQAIVPSDSTLLEGFSAIVCLTPGNLIMQGVEGVSITYPLTAGQRLEFSPRKIMAATTGTYAGWR